MSLPPETKAKKILHALHDNALQVLETYLPGGEMEGVEYVARNPTRDDTNAGSFKFNVKTGAFNDFADLNSHGSGLLALLKFLGVNPGAAVAKHGWLPRKDWNRRQGVPKLQGFGQIPTPDTKKKPPAKPIAEKDISLKLPEGSPVHGKVVASYPYLNPQSKVLFYTLRCEKEGKKAVVPIRWDAEHSKWDWGLPEGPYPLYNGHLIKEHIVHFGEGEKVADSLSKSFPEDIAVTSVGGSSRLLQSDLIALKRATRVVVWPDNDEAGGHYARQIAAWCTLHDVKISVVPCPSNWGPGDDFVDHPDPTRIKYAVEAQVFCEDNLSELIEVGASVDDVLLGARIKNWATAFGITVTDLKARIKAARQRLNAVEEAPPPPPEAPTDGYTSEELEAGREILTAPDVLTRAIKQVHQAGVLGEDDLISMTYLCAVSARLEMGRPVSLMVQAEHGTGKSFTTTCTLNLLPENCKLVLSSYTANALNYIEENELSHKVVYLMEASSLINAGNHDSVQADLRTLMTEGILTRKVAIPQESGPAVTEDKTVRGPICLISTTTSKDLSPETRSRMIVAQTDCSAEQTARVLDLKAQGAADLSAAASAEESMRSWQAAFAILATHGQKRVVIPFLKQAFQTLGKNMPTSYRRDFGDSLIGLIRASAMLEQECREGCDASGRVVEGGDCVLATLEDYEVARRLVNSYLAMVAGRSGESKLMPLLNHLATIWPEDTEAWVIPSNRCVAEAISANHSTISRHLKAAVEEGYLSQQNMDAQSGRYRRTPLFFEVTDEEGAQDILKALKAPGAPKARGEK